MNKKYKVVISNNGLGAKAVLYYKFLFFWIPDTISQCANGYDNTEETAIRWQDNFNIPDELIIFK